VSVKGAGLTLHFAGKRGGTYMPLASLVMPSSNAQRHAHSVLAIPDGEGKLALYSYVPIPKAKVIDHFTIKVPAINVALRTAAATSYLGAWSAMLPGLPQLAPMWVSSSGYLDLTGLSDATLKERRKLSEILMGLSGIGLVFGVYVGIGGPQPVLKGVGGGLAILSAAGLLYGSNQQAKIDRELRRRGISPGATKGSSTPSKGSNPTTTKDGSKGKSTGGGNTGNETDKTSSHDVSRPEHDSGGQVGCSTYDRPDGYLTICRPDSRPGPDDDGTGNPRSRAGDRPSDDSSSPVNPRSRNGERPSDDTNSPSNPKSIVAFPNPEDTGPSGPRSFGWALLGSVRVPFTMSRGLALHAVAIPSQR
jgi:hypothetical protein